MKKIFHKKPIKTSTAQKDPRMEDDKRRKKTDNEEIWEKVKERPEERRLTMKKYGRKLKKDQKKED